jgi:DNA-binding NarL/FixJ family response regulator
MSITAFVAEDHEVFRGVLLTVLRSMRGVTVCGSSASAEDAPASLAGTPADLVLVDLSLPHMNGFELVAEVRKRFPNTRCIMVSGHTT